MTPEAFTQLLHTEGYLETIIVERQANEELPEHAHPFASKALILDGELTLEVAGQRHRYQQGDIFVLENSQAHHEWYGAEGVRYLVGRK